MKFVLLALLFFSATTPASAHENMPVIVSAHGFMVKGYQEILARFNGDPSKITPDLSPGRYNRNIAELVILIKALRIGGLTAPIKFNDGCNARRGVEEVIRGNTTVFGQQLDLMILGKTQDIKDLYISDAVSQTGEFNKVIYCLEDNKKVLAARTVKELNQAGRGIIGVDWDNDRNVLVGMGITNLTTAATFPSMIKMIIAGRADWIPMEANSNQDMELVLEGHRFIPVPGIRFSLIEPRHFLVSRTHPAGEATFKALQKGLKELRRQEFIHKILAATGFYATDALGWCTLNAKAVQEAQKKNEDKN